MSRFDPSSLVDKYTRQLGSGSGKILSCYEPSLVVQYYVHVLKGESPMEAISYTNARSNLAKTMEKVCADHDPVIITRRNENSVVLMSLEDFQALEETAYLLRSPKNARRLLESIAELESNGGTERELTL